ncbi:uncharacterized protein PV06_08763 [Exophiala oligosperma]|uniref:Transcription factor domain-containing protein n=1 Tax=Exophiala oligosperma TaxID=215243 RepID=A0A0D2BN65_9EURO|nr:uncharacterized protein PV06_08763 [Exophiala oligosperma]KIW38942.1 hypothetical protein PV06_08763 [Exophiala oligosperma]
MENEPSAQSQGYKTMRERQKKSPTFLWVNKDEASLSLSSSDRRETQRIFSFVQRQRSDAKSEVLKGSRVSRHDPTLIRRPRPLHIRPSRHPTNTSTANRSPSQPEVDDGVKTPVQESSREHPQTSKRVNDFIRRHRYRIEVVSKHNWLPGSGVDPFSATPFPITRHVEALIKYYWIFAMTGAHNDKTEILPPRLQPVNRYTTVRDNALQGAMQSRIRFVSIMVIMAARMVHISRIPTIGSPPPEYYLQMTLHEVRGRMMECQDQGISDDASLLRAVQCLALAEYICQRYDAANVHLQAAKKLLPMKPSGHPSDAFTREGIVNIDNLVCIETGRLPIFPVLYDPGPLDEARMTAIREDVMNHSRYRVGANIPFPFGSDIPDATRPSSAFVSHEVDILVDAPMILDWDLGSGFERALAAGAIPPLMTPIVRDLLDVLTVAKYVWRTPDARKEDADWMCKRARAFVHHLLLLPANPDFVENTIKSRKAEALRIAVLLMLIRCTNRVSFRSATPNMRLLQCALYGIDMNWSNDVFRLDQTNLPKDSKDSSPSPSVSPASCSSRTSSPLLGPFGPALRSVQTRQYDENELLLWILLTGHFTAQGEPEEAWFLERASYVAQHHLRIDTYDGLHEFMGRYFYSKTQQKHSLDVVALHLSLL